MIPMARPGDGAGQWRPEPPFDADPFNIVLDHMTTCWYNHDYLPGIWLTEPVHDEDGIYKGRIYLSPYVAEDDIDGEEALKYGMQYFGEALLIADSRMARERRGLFQAAELLFRHGKGQDNSRAELYLGYLYYHDFAKRSNWIPLQSSGSVEWLDGQSVEDRYALSCFLGAALGGVPVEGEYKAGDCFKNGIGCPANPGVAEVYYRAAAMSDAELEERVPYQTMAMPDREAEPYVMGNALLRKAGCLEEGDRFFEPDYLDALENYRAAESYLETAVEQGHWYFKRALREARDGILRCEQEIALGS